MATFSLSGTTAPAGHQHIYEALRGGDRERPQREMHEHVLFARDTLLRSFEVEGKGRWR